MFNVIAVIIIRKAKAIVNLFLLVKDMISSLIKNLSELHI